uniref:Glycosyltransferase family 92 protein n=1 Tax=Oryzias sinensis TaxID=183150 RepID=A0A8C7XVB3_9TELE
MKYVSIIFIVTVPPAQPATLVAVNGMKTLLVSAYLEHRSKVKKVRIIAIKPRKEKASYLCHLRCEKKLKITRADYKTHSDHFRFHYGTADIMCPLPSGCPTPSHVAVTSAHVNPEGTLDQDFLEVQNLKTEFQSFPFNFTVCFSTMFDYTNVLQLVQSLEMLQLLGVNRVVIYKTNCSLETQNVLDYYTHKGRVCWLELLPLLEKKFGANKRYRFRSHVFPNDVLLPPPIFPNTLLQHSWGNVSGVNILSHLYREPLPSTAWIDFKIIVNPREVFSLTVHGALKSLKPFEWVTSDMARMYHTR